jgi:amidase
VRERISSYERAHGLAHEWHHHRERISERMRATIQKGFAMAPAQYWEAQRTAQRCRSQLPQIFDGLDALLVPSTQGEAPKGLERTGDARFQELWTMLHVPSMTLPTHRGPNGLPVGIQLVAPYGAEDRLFDVARWAWKILGGGSK